VPGDSDGDGCTDAQESGDNPLFGGDRNPQYWWDFYDVTADRLIDLDDALEVLAHFGHGPNDDALDHAIDRIAPDSLRPYRSAEAPPDSTGIDLADALVSLASFGHGCDQ
jgi:hypothetical protein